MRKARLRELDFLRGVAIILILLRHQQLFSCTTNMGWIGVDLFFVLSGFLVSGLLFREYLEFGNIQPNKFLIRRGFKIYPIYFIFYLFYFIPILYKGNLNIIGFLSDLTFFQNYVWGWGYAYAASWSLAVEEHFYFCFLLFFQLGLKYNFIKLKEIDSQISRISRFEILIILVMIFCIMFRLYRNIAFPEQFAFNFTMTHLRIDSILSGVLISYLFYFRLDYLKKIYQSYKNPLLVLSFLGILWTPLVDPTTSFFAKTFGFSFLYFSFGILLVAFLFTSDINNKLNRIFSTTIVNFVSKMGYCSYSIYIIHSFVNIQVYAIYSISNYYNHYLNFLFTSALSIIFGMFMTFKIENYFLGIRDKHYPNRIASVSTSELLMVTISSKQAF